jgi:hypothetical protein
VVAVSKESCKRTAVRLYIVLYVLLTVARALLCLYAKGKRSAAYASQRYIYYAQTVTEQHRQRVCGTAVCLTYLLKVIANVLSLMMLIEHRQACILRRRRQASVGTPCMCTASTTCVPRCWCVAQRGP